MLQGGKKYMIKLNGEPHIFEISHGGMFASVYGKAFDKKVAVSLAEPDLVGEGCLLGIKMTDSGTITQNGVKEKYYPGNAFSFKVTEIKEVRENAQQR